MKALTTIILTSAISLGGYRLWDNHDAKSPLVAPPAVAKAKVETPAPAPAAETPAIADTTPAPANVEFESAELIAAVQQGIVQATLRGNAREKLTAKLRNNSPTPLRVSVPAGQVLESGRNAVVVLRAAEAEIMPAQSVELSLTTAALRSTNKVADVPFKLSYQEPGRGAAFLAWLTQHPEVSTPAAQTALLALGENLPLNAFAKFASTKAGAVKFETDAFRVETGDIIEALGALRASGVKTETLAISTDSQLRIEAMIEPLSREAAKRFYGITEEHEWEFWKQELLSGDPSTRHYALFGIARFYPDVALEMLPKWVREAKTHPVYRMAALQALADTQRAEALPVLRQLAVEFGEQTDLGKSATQAANFLDQRLAQLENSAAVVAFRGTAGPEIPEQF